MQVKRNLRQCVCFPNVLCFGTWNIYPATLSNLKNSNERTETKFVRKVVYAVNAESAEAKEKGV